MKKRFFYVYVSALFMSLFMAVSCINNDDFINSNSEYRLSYGVIETIESSVDFLINEDSGQQLKVTENQAPSFKIKDGQRVVVNYSIISTEADLLNVRLNAIDSILTKGVVKQSFINMDAEHRSDSLGNTPIIGIENAWFADKYLNINFEFASNTSLNVKHMISLIYDNVTLEDGAVVLTLRHNDFTDTSSSLTNLSRAFSSVSFDLTSIVPAGQTSQKIILKWEEYTYYGFGATEIIERSDEGVFELPNEPMPISGQSINSLINGVGYVYDDATSLK